MSQAETYQVEKRDLLGLLDYLVIDMCEESRRRKFEGGHSPLFGIYLEQGNPYRPGRMLLSDVEGSQLEIKADQRSGEGKGILSPTTLAVIDVPEVGEEVVEICMHRKKDLAINPSTIYELIGERSTE